MKIDGVMIKDDGKDIYFAFIRQFPGVCAQGKTAEETDQKVRAYFKAFMEKAKDADVEMGKAITI